MPRQHHLARLTGAVALSILAWLPFPLFSSLSYPENHEIRSIFTEVWEVRAYQDAANATSPLPSASIDGGGWVTWGGKARRTNTLGCIYASPSVRMAWMVNICEPQLPGCSHHIARPDSSDSLLAIKHGLTVMSRKHTWLLLLRVRNKIVPARGAAEHFRAAGAVVRGLGPVSGPRHSR